MRKPTTFASRHIGMTLEACQWSNYGTMSKRVKFRAFTDSMTCPVTV